MTTMHDTFAMLMDEIKGLTLKCKDLKRLAFYGHSLNRVKRIGLKMCSSRKENLPRYICQGF